MYRKYLKLGDISLGYTLLLTPSPDPLVLCSITDPLLLLYGILGILVPYCSLIGLSTRPDGARDSPK